MCRLQAVSAMNKARVAMAASTAEIRLVRFANVVAA